jgi:hypothetical protein
MTSAVLNELAADAYGAADPAEPFVHPNETLCENGLNDVLACVKTKAEFLRSSGGRLAAIPSARHVRCIFICRALSRY